MPQHVYLACSCVTYPTPSLAPHGIVSGSSWCNDFLDSTVLSISRERERVHRPMETLSNIEDYNICILLAYR